MRFREAAKFEIEVCDAARTNARDGRVRGMLVPVDVLLARTRDDVPFSIGATTGTNTGGKVVATQLLAGSFIDALRNKTVLMRLGTQLAGLVGNCDIPRQSGLLAAGWIGEDDDAPGTEFDFDTSPLRAKTCAARAVITREMLLQPAIGVEAFVRGEIINAMSRTIDLAGFYGLGNNHQPKGVKNYAGLRGVAFANVRPTFQELVDMETQIRGRVKVDTAPDLQLEPGKLSRAIARTTLSEGRFSASLPCRKPSSVSNFFQSQSFKHPRFIRNYL